MNNRTGKIISVLLSAIMLFSLLAGCAEDIGENVLPASGDRRIRIVTTLFPQYDFARTISGDKAEVSILLDPGVESHMYDPSVKDMVKITECDVFIYTGELMEPWAARITGGLGEKGPVVIDASAGIELIESNHHHGEEEHDHEEEEPELDPHIWLDLALAAEMVDNIAAGISLADPDNSEYYMQNARDYKKEILALDGEFFETVSSGKRDTLVFGGPFAYSYLFERYGLDHVGLYDSCSSEAEPSMARMREIIDYMGANEVKILFIDENGEGRPAASVAAQTGAECVVFHTCHNLALSEAESGAAFTGLMRKNLEALERGLNE